MSPSDAAGAAVAMDATAKLWATTWQSLAQSMPPTVREILHAYTLQGEHDASDREMLLSLLAAKIAEDQVSPRLAPYSIFGSSSTHGRRGYFDNQNTDQCAGGMQRIAALANLAVLEAQQSLILLQSPLGGVNGYPPERSPTPSSDLEEGDTLRDDCEDVSGPSRRRNADFCGSMDVDGRSRQALDHLPRDEWHSTNAKASTSSANPEGRSSPQDDPHSFSNPRVSPGGSHPTKSRQNEHQHRHVSHLKIPHARGLSNSSHRLSSGSASLSASRASERQSRQLNHGHRPMAPLPISSTFYPSRREAPQPQDVINSPDRSTSSLPFPRSSHCDSSRSPGVSKERLMGNVDDSSRFTHRPISMVREVLGNDEDSESD